MATKRKAASSKTRSSSKSSATRSSDRVGRFFRAFLLSAVSAFCATSYVINPQWQNGALLDTLQAKLGELWPGASQASLVRAPTGDLVKTSFAQCPQFFPAGQPPTVVVTQPMRELCFSTFAVLHGASTRTPVLVAERLNRQMLARASGLQRTDRFYAEARLPKSERAELDDYRNSGYVRGHMAPAGDMSDGNAMAQSFSLANMVPQDLKQNSGPWNRIEQDTRKYIMRAAGDVYVLTGPVYEPNPRVIGERRVAVPSYLFKVVYDATTGRSWVHWQANNAQAKVGPPISYSEFVRRTGLHVLPSS